MVTRLFIIIQTLLIITTIIFTAGYALSVEDTNHNNQMNNHKADNTYNIYE